MDILILIVCAAAALFNFLQMMSDNPVDADVSGGINLVFGFILLITIPLNFEVISEQDSDVITVERFHTVHGTDSLVSVGTQVIDMRYEDDEECNHTHTNK